MNFCTLLLHLTVSLIIIVSINGVKSLKKRRVEAEIGESITISCGKMRNVTWKRKGELPPKAEVFSDGLFIPSVNYSDIGTYYCRSGEEGQATLAVLLKILDQNQIKPVLKEVKRYGDAKFECLSDTLPKWRFYSNKHKKLPANAIANGKVLNILKINLQNEGFYECEGTTNSYEFIAKGELRVYSEDYCRTSPVNQRAFIGQEANIFCVSESKVKWTFNAGKLPNNTVALTGDLYNTLTIEKVYQHNQGTYECKGMKDKNRFYSESHLKVIGKPPKPIILQPSDGPPMYEIIEPGEFPYYYTSPVHGRSFKLCNSWPCKPKSVRSTTILNFDVYFLIAACVLVVTCCSTF